MESNKVKTVQVIKQAKGITLIALVITIIILIILAGVSINILFGKEGIVEKAKEASFKNKFRQVEEAVQTYKLNKEAENMLSDVVTSNIENLPVANKLSSSEIDGLEETLKTEIQEISSVEDITTLNLYYIDKTKVKIKRDYIINVDTMQLYDVKGEKYFGKRHHTLSGEGQEDKQKESPEIKDEPTITIEGDIGWYSPNMNGFNKAYTFMEYYNSADFDDVKQVPVEEYIQNGKQSKIEENGKTYVLDDYQNKVWANIKTTGNGLEAWWVWIPRYAYKVNETEKKIDVIFVDLENKPIGTKYTSLPEGYELHPAFTPSGDDGSKNLQGIWMSKYESSNKDVATQQEEGNTCYAPDMSGFNKNYTYIELYDKSSDTFSSEVLLKDANLDTINNNSNWYSYKDKIWANIKTTGNGLEAWWVWIPRYAYYVNEASKEVEIIFVDLNNKPFEKELYGDKLPENFMVHPAFTPSGEDGSKNLKGIWMSKYESSNLEVTKQTQRDSLCYAPDMTGFNQDYTYIELYDKETDTFTQEVNLKEANLETINNDSKWYDYQNKIWANIKTTGNGLEAWWVWIPRYAYYVNEASKEVEIIFIDLDNKPFEKELYGDTLPENFTVHPAFTPSGEDGSKNLKGIWMSKYESSNVSDTISGTAPTGSASLAYSSDKAGNNHSHEGNGAGTKLRYVTSSTKWCNAYDGTPCSNNGYYIYCSQCGVRLRHYWCANHYDPSTKVIIDDENVE